MSVRYACDKCGKIIKGKRGYLSWCFRDDNDDLGENILEGMDFCQDCMNKIREYIGGEAPEVKTEIAEIIPPEKVPDQEETPEPKKRKSIRLNWDDGKIGALLKAGWSVQQIAEEIKAKPNTLYHHISEMKKEGKI